MKRGLVALAAVALLLLSGCTNTVTSETVTVTPGSSGTFSDGDTTVEVEPLTAETPASSDDDASFLSTVRSELRSDNVIPNASDEQLLAAGQKACDAIDAGADTLALSLIDGEKTDASGFYPDSAVIIASARATICD